jgi:hypothetical protein
MAGSEPSLDMRVAVFSSDPETLDGLTDYLRAAGARALPMRELRYVEPVDVIVLFGDDFDAASAKRFVRAWASAKAARPVLILTTSHQELADDVRAEKSAIVLRRPVWGWVLLAAIRSAIGDVAVTRAARLPK